MAPRSVGPYEILSVVGRGGIGTVYRGRHRATGRLAAVKVLGPAPATDATAARRLAREFEVLRTLHHPNVVHVFEAGVAEGCSFLAMELVEGLDLRAYLSPALDDDHRVSLEDALIERSPASGDPDASESRPGPDAIRALAAMMDEPETEPERWPAAAARAAAWPNAPPPPPPSAELLAALNRPARLIRMRAVLLQVLDALAYVHGRGLVHRDLKPSNIMVDDRRRARLMDFGLVKAASDRDEPLTAHGRVVGTYRYMSPEQAQGRPVDARSDLYSLGVILFELVAGAPPFPARDPVELWRDILHRAAPGVEELNPGADPRLAAIARRLLQKDPADRYQSADEISHALRA